MRRRPLAITALLATTTLLAACGGSDTAGDSATTETAAEATPTETDTADPTDTAEPTETGDAAAESGTVVEVAKNAGNFTTLTTAIDAAGLTSTLEGEGPFTVFAPPDEVFEALPEGTVEGLLADPQGQLTQVLTYHVVPQRVMAADVAELDGQEVTTVQGGTFTVNVQDGQVSLTDATGATVNVTNTDIEASNGVIHVIDGVLMPS